MFITDAFAQAAEGATAQGSTTMTMIMIAGMFAVFYFLVLRPQNKRQKEHQNMINALAKGDEVVLAGGILGRITKITESLLTVEISEGVEILVQRTAVLNVLPKGTIR